MTDTVFDLSGNVAVVTGGNGGIGRGVALALAQAGADIAIFARDAAKSQETCEAIEAIGRKAAAFSCDVRRRAEIDAAVAGTLSAFGRISIVVNNSGIARLAPHELLSEADWDSVLDTNLKGALLTAQACFPSLRANGRGKVINIGSEYSLFGASRNLAYGASKGALLTLTYGLADAWARHNIQVNAILPGIIETDIWGASLEASDLRTRMEKRTPAGRIGLPGDVGPVSVFLASHASDFVTGQWIAVDGGFNVADPINR
jgi:2-deoxy-D-gluconate 3-dehydrogenase